MALPPHIIRYTFEVHSHGLFEAFDVRAIRVVFSPLLGN